MRDILDLRQRAQQKLIETVLQSADPSIYSPKNVQSMQSICVEYFTLSYGHESLGVTSQRILEFLETSVLYSSHALFSYMTKFFFMDNPLDIRQELNLW